MEWIDKLISVVMYALTLGYFRWWLSREFGEMKHELKSKVDTDRCEERTETCSADVSYRLNSLEKQLLDSWGVINKHGHKGLEGENNQVVRL